MWVLTAAVLVIVGIAADLEYRRSGLASVNTDQFYVDVGGSDVTALAVRAHLLSAITMSLGSLAVAGVLRLLLGKVIASGRLKLLLVLQWVVGSLGGLAIIVAASVMADNLFSYAYDPTALAPTNRVATAGGWMVLASLALLVPIVITARNRRRSDPL